jgi:hypothetical protein
LRPRLTLTVANQNKSKTKANCSTRKHASHTWDNQNSDSDETRDRNQTEEDPRPEGQNSPSNFVGLTVAKFESQLPKWSIYQLCQALHKSKDPLANRIAPEVQDDLTLIQQNYVKSKLMLAAIGNFSEETVNKSL